MNTFNHNLVVATAKGYAKRIGVDMEVQKAMLILENAFAAIDAIVIEPERPDAYSLVLKIMGAELEKKGLRKFW